MKIQPLNGSFVWIIVSQYIQQTNSFKSLSGIKYNANSKLDAITYYGGNRNNGNEETINKFDFIDAFNSICKLSEINTNTIKKIIPNTLYRKRTPFLGLLYSAKIISN